MGSDVLHQSGRGPNSDPHCASHRKRPQVVRMTPGIALVMPSMPLCRQLPASGQALGLTANPFPSPLSLYNLRGGSCQPHFSQIPAN